MVDSSFAVNLWTPLRLAAAVLPPLLILVLMAGLRRTAVAAGCATWILTLALVLLAFGANLPLIIISQAKAAWMGLDVLGIVWGALLFHAVCAEAGVVASVGSALSGGTASRGLNVLAVGWVFASFVQGAGGFGVPVVVTAPLLMAMGFPALQAVLLPAIGHAWAVTFGSLGTSFMALMAVSGLPAEVLAPAAALLLGIGCLVCGLLVGALGLDRAEFRRTLPWIFLLALGMGGTQYFLAVWGFWQVAALGGGLTGLVLVFLAGRIQSRASPTAPAVQTGRMRAGFAAYGLLVLIILAAKLIPPIHDLLQTGAVQPAFPQAVSGLGYSTPAEAGASIAPLGHAGALLGYSALAAAVLFAGLGYFRRGAVPRILRSLMATAAPVSLGILAMVGISTLMAHSGMTFILAEGLARVSGSFFPLASPWIGALGAFLTGSNANSNLLCAPLQQRIAARLGLPERLLLAGQTAGGAAGSVLSPAKVLLGASAAGGGALEGRVLRRLLLPVGLILAVFSVVLAGLIFTG
jgi:lactate permease